MSEILEFVIAGKDKYSSTFNKLKSHLPSIKTLAIGAAGGITALSAALLAAAKTTATAYDKVQKFSDQTALSTEYLSKMTVAADYAGVSQESLFKSIQKLTIGVGEAGRGIGQAKDTFEELGISVYNANGSLKTSEQLMPVLADKFKGMTDSTKRLEMAQKLFGQRNTEMLQLLNQGSDAMEEYQKRAEAMGVVISEQAGANAALFNDTIADSTRILKGLKNVIGEQVMPYITGLAMKFNDFAVNNRDRIIEFGKSFLQTMLNMLEKGAYVVAGLMDAWRGLRMLWESLKIGISLLAEAQLKMLDAIAKQAYKTFVALNYKGVFDSMLIGVGKLRMSLNDTMDTLAQTREGWSNTLGELANTDSAIQKVGEYNDKIRDGIVALGELGQAKAQQNETDIENLVTKLDQENDIKQQQADIDAANEEKELLRKQILSKKELAIEKAKGAAMMAFQNLQASKSKAIAKTGAIAETIYSTYLGAQQAFTSFSNLGPWGVAAGIAAATAAVGAGLGRVSEMNAAHGGMTNVPKEQTYLLDRGERVLSPNQNKDLTEYMNNGGGSNIENVNIEILPNATNAEALLYMNKNDWLDIAENNIIPALRTLSGQGVTI